MNAETAGKLIVGIVAAALLAVAALSLYTCRMTEDNRKLRDANRNRVRLLRDASPSRPLTIHETDRLKAELKAYPHQGESY